MNSETPKEGPARRLPITYGLWTMLLQVIFSMVYIRFSLVFKSLWANMLRGESLPVLTSLALNIWFQTLCCGITLCIVFFAWWKGGGMAEKRIKYLLLLMTMDALWGWFTIRYAIYPMFRIDFFSLS